MGNNILFFSLRVSGRCLIDKPFLCIATPGNKAKMKDYEGSPLGRASWDGGGGEWDVAESYREASELVIPI